MNLLAFRWGRLAVVDARWSSAPSRRRQAGGGAARALRGGEAARRRRRPDARGELRRLLEIRVPELIAYQDAAYARRYTEFVGRVAEAERRQTPGRTGLAEAVARHLFKLMAYKDEYEVARLHLDPALHAEIRARFGEGARATWNLHPPLLRALGLERKLKLGPWFAPVFKGLRAMKRLRGTALDPFGRAEVRRVERALVDEYRGMIETVLTRLGPATHDTAVAIGELPDLVRGYEAVKLESVARFRGAARALLAKLG